MSQRLVLITLSFALFACKPSADPAKGSENPANKAAATNGGTVPSKATGSSDAAVGLLPNSADKQTSGAERTPTVVKVPGLDTFVPVKRTKDSARFSNMERSPSGIEHAVLKLGTGDSPPRGAVVTLHYTGWIVRGSRLATQFKDSRVARVTQEFLLRDDNLTTERSSPESLRGLIPGLVETLADMKKGERRWVVVPSRLGWKRAGYPPRIPSNADLAWDVELVDFR